jgi:hypothetical protein
VKPAASLGKRIWAIASVVFLFFFIFLMNARGYQVDKAWRHDRLCISMELWNRQPLAISKVPSLMIIPAFRPLPFVPFCVFFCIAVFSLALDASLTRPMSAAFCGR